jgi:hypothetical protein
MKNLKVGDRVKFNISSGLYYNYRYIPPNSIGIISGISLGKTFFYVDFTINNDKICVDVVEDVIEKISDDLDIHDDRNPINNDDIINLKILLGVCNSSAELIESI